MPQSTGGGYTPLTASEKGLLTSTMEVYLRNHPTASPTDAVIYAVGRTGIHVDNSDAIVLYNLESQAAAANAAAQAAGQNPNLPPDPSTIPNVFGDPMDTGRYVTTYVVEITDPATGEKTTSQEQDVSDTPPSAADLQAEVANNPNAYIRNVGSHAAQTSFAGGVIFDVIILSIVHVR